MQVVEITGSNIPKFPPEQLYRPEEAYFPGKPATEECHDYARHGDARQMGTHRPDFLELGFSKRQILLVIFEICLNFPSSLIALVNPRGGVKKFIAYEYIVNDFLILQLASTHHEEYFSVNVVMCPDTLIIMLLLKVFPLTFRNFFYDFRRCQQFSLKFELIFAVRLADDTESRGIGGIHDFLNMVGTVKGEFDLSEVASPPVACLPQTDDLVTCDVVFRAVVGMSGRQPQDESRRDHRVAGNRQHENIVVAHDVTVFGIVEQFMYEFHIFTGFFGFGVVKDDPDPPAALLRLTRKAEIVEKPEKQRHGQHAEQFLKSLRMPRQNSVKLPQIPAVLSAEFAERVLLQEGEKDEDPYPLVQMRGFMVRKTGPDDEKSQGSSGQLSDKAGGLFFLLSPAHFSVSFLCSGYQYMYTLLYSRAETEKQEKNDRSGKYDDKICIFNNLHQISTKNDL